MKYMIFKNIVMVQGHGAVLLLQVGSTALCLGNSGRSNEGAILDYSDPHVLVFPKMREHNFDMSSVTLSAEVVAKYDCVVLTTDHDKFDYDLILQNSKLLVDTRGKFRKAAKNLVRA